MIATAGGAAGTVPGLGLVTVAPVPNVGSPLPSLHDSCASQHASGSPSIKQCWAHESQMKQTSGLPHSEVSHSSASLTIATGASRSAGDRARSRGGTVPPFSSTPRGRLPRGSDPGSSRRSGTRSRPSIRGTCPPRGPGSHQVRCWCGEEGLARSTRGRPRRPTSPCSLASRTRRRGTPRAPCHRRCRVVVGAGDEPAGVRVAFLDEGSRLPAAK
jgi:hypothetical protein